MYTLDHATLETLAHEAASTCVSAYLPTSRAGAETQQNPIRFRKLLKEAESVLVARGFREAEARDWLAPAAALLADSAFWLQQGDGLAVFLTDRSIRTFRLPVTFDEAVRVNTRLYLMPLLPLVDADDDFLVLAVSQNRVRLFEADRNEIHEVAVPGLPHNMKDALHYDRPEGQFQARSTFRGTKPKQGVVFHGQGITTAHAKDDLLDYFRLIDAALAAVLAHEKRPLVVATVDSSLPVYRQANTYARLIEQHIAGNPDYWTEHQLHDHARTVMQSHFRAHQRERLQKLQHQIDGGQGSCEIAAVLPAAHAGRVHELFVTAGATQPGFFDSATSHVTLADAGHPGGEDLVERAAMETLLHGGAVHCVAPDEMLAPWPVAAVFRYQKAETQATYNPPNPM